MSYFMGNSKPLTIITIIVINKNSFSGIVHCTSKIRWCIFFMQSKDPIS